MKGVNQLYKYLFLCLIVFQTACSGNRAMFELSANQSMCMTGKGPGQDGAINPYYGTDSYAIVSNKGDYPIGIRIMQGESMIINKALKGKSKEKFRLKADEQLYFDTEYESKVALSFKMLD